MDTQIEGKQGAQPSVELHLTEEQKAELARVFGDEIINRVRSIRVEQIAGYLKTEMRRN